MFAFNRLFSIMKYLRRIMVGPKHCHDRCQLLCPRCILLRQTVHFRHGPIDLVNPMRLLLRGPRNLRDQLYDLRRTSRNLFGQWGQAMGAMGSGFGYLDFRQLLPDLAHQLPQLCIHLRLLLQELCRRTQCRGIPANSFAQFREG